MTYNLDKFDRVLVVETEDLVEAKSVDIANNITDPRLKMRTDLTYTDYIDPITTVGPGATSEMRSPYLCLITTSRPLNPHHNLSSYYSLRSPESVE